MSNADFSSKRSTKVQTTDSSTALRTGFEVTERWRKGGNLIQKAVTERGKGYTKETLEAPERIPST